MNEAAQLFATDPRGVSDDTVIGDGTANPVTGGVQHPIPRGGGSSFSTICRWGSAVHIRTVQVELHQDVEVPFFCRGARC